MYVYINIKICIYTHNTGVCVEIKSILPRRQEFARNFNFQRFPDFWDSLIFSATEKSMRPASLQLPRLQPSPLISLLNHNYLTLVRVSAPRSPPDLRRPPI